jgi:hypothetical protein
MEILPSEQAIQPGIWSLHPIAFWRKLRTSPVKAAPFRGAFLLLIGTLCDALYC